MSPELKRRIVEILVEKIQADTVETLGRVAERDYDYVSLRSTKRAGGARSAASPPFDQPKSATRKTGYARRSSATPPARGEAYTKASG